MLKVMSVCVGAKYSDDYVVKLKDSVAKYLPLEHEFVCLSDRDIEGVTTVRVDGLDGWWAKLHLFKPEIRGNCKAIYLDLDTVIVGDISPLAKVEADFAVCENFARLAGARSWPCKYGSCAMVFKEGWGQHVWDEFVANKEKYMIDPYGDQYAIERIVPDAILLQRVLPRNFFLHYRKFTNVKPKDTAIAVFAGRHKPHNSPFKWIKDSWK